MSNQKQMQLWYDERQHTRNNIQTGFQTAGIFSRAKEKVVNFYQGSKKRAGNITDSVIDKADNINPFSEDEKQEQITYDIFGNKIKGGEGGIKDEKLAKPLGVPIAYWGIGGIALIGAGAYTAYKQ